MNKNKKMNIRYAAFLLCALFVDAFAISNVEVQGGVITWEGESWYQVQDASSWVTVPGCEGLINQCITTGAGRYNIVSPNARVENVIVESDSLPSESESMSSSSQSIGIFHSQTSCNLLPYPIGGFFRSELNDECVGYCPKGSIAVGGGCSAETLPSQGDNDNSIAKVKTSGMLTRDSYECLAQENTKVDVTVACLSVTSIRGGDAEILTAPSAPVEGVTVFYATQTIQASGYITENGAPYYNGQRYFGVLGWESVVGADGYDIYLNEKLVGTSYGNSDNGGFNVGRQYGPGQGRCCGGGYASYSLPWFRYQVVAWTNSGLRSQFSPEANFVFDPSHPSVAKQLQSDD